MSTEQLIAELKAAGWKQCTVAIWRAPSGTLYRGPVGAWRAMKEAERAAKRAAEPAPVDYKQRAAGDKDE